MASSPHVLLTTVEPSSIHEALLDPHWTKATQEEFTALNSNHTWDLVPFSSDMNLISCKWVFHVKYKSDGSILKHKAHLVAKGFLQTPGIDYEETFSPVVKAPTIRVFFSLVVSFGWDIQQVDINNAFLNGDLTEDVYMAQPEGFIDSQFPSYVCKLRKSLYGLKQAPRAWYTKLCQALQGWGFIQSVFDASLFIKGTTKAVLLLLVYVDDILVIGSNSSALKIAYMIWIPILLSKI